jgi:hypothetical protein
MVDRSVVIHTFDGNIAKKGAYSFPFAFNIPDGIPSSLEYQKDYVKLCVRYKLKAFMNPTDKKNY